MKRKIFTVALIITLMISQAFVVGATELKDERISDAIGMNADRDSMATSTNISLARTYSGTITSTNTEDYYRFTIGSSGRINLTATAGMKYVRYGIYDASGNRIFDKYYYWNSVTEMSSINEAVDLNAGTYYLAVLQYYDYTGDYIFKIDFASANESFMETCYDRDNSMSTANDISIGQQYNGQIAAYNDEKDFYRFTMNQSGRVYLTAIARMKYIRYGIYDVSGNPIFDHYYYWNSTSEMSSINEAIDLTAGTYYLAIVNYYGYTGNYTFKLSQHTHNYKTEVTKATINSNGSIVKRCSCGAVQSSSVIYRPRWYTISPKTYEYNGKKRTPSITMTDAAGRIISSSNYSLTYPSGRKNVGTYRIKVTMKGNYTGSFYASFDIIPKSTSIVKLSPKTKGFKVVWKKNSTVSGYQVQYSTSKKFTGTKTKTISGKKNESVTISGLKAKKKYYVRVRTYKTVRGKKYFSDWSKVRSVKTK